MALNILLTFTKKKNFQEERFSIVFLLTNVLLNGTILPSELPLRTDNNLSSCYFTKVDILRIINNLDPNKAHGHDKITIPMLKMCVYVCVFVCVCVWRGSECSGCPI